MFFQTLLTYVERIIMLLRSWSWTPTYICHSYTGNAQKHAFIHKKCFTPTLGGNTKRVLVGIIALRSLKCLSKYFLVTEGGMRLCKIKVLKKKKGKRDKCPRNKEEYKIAHTILYKDHHCFRERKTYSKEQCRIRISHYIYIPHTCTSWSKSMLFPSMDLCFDLAKYAR